MKEPLGRVLKLWVLNLKINTNLWNTIPKEDNAIISRRWQIICRKRNKINQIYLDAAESITSCEMNGKTWARTQRKSRGSYYFGVSKYPLNVTNPRPGLFFFFFHTEGLSLSDHFYNCPFRDNSNMCVSNWILLQKFRFIFDSINTCL